MLVFIVFLHLPHPEINLFEDYLFLSVSETGLFGY